MNRLLTALLSMAAVSSFGQIVLNDVYETAGVQHQPFPSNYLGGGAAWCDLNSDGWEDLYLTGTADIDRIYLNNGDGTFSELDLDLTETEWYNTMGAITADYDRDGDEDIFVTTWRINGSQNYAPNLLYRNNGDSTFTEIAQQAGIVDASFSTSCTWTDVNLDGWIDLYVGNYVTGPAFLLDENNAIIGFDHTCGIDWLYLNNGDGTFTNVTAEYGIINAGCTLASRTTDLDADLDPDLLVGNDFGEWVIPNRAFLNELPENSFTPIESESGANQGIYAMGIATADFDRDGDFDHYYCNLGRNVLLERQSDLSFVDATAVAGVENTGADSLLFTSWGVGFGDLDNDGWEDLVVVNGHIPTIAQIATETFDPDKLYYNNGDGTFTDISEAVGFADVGIGRGSAMADFDRDGRLDVFNVNVFSPFASDLEHSPLYHNETVGGNWISAELTGTYSNTDAIGARLEVHTSAGVFLREVSGGGDTHLSQHSRLMHVGLGTLATVDSVMIHWPSGIVNRYTNPAVNAFHSWTESIQTAVNELDPVKLHVWPNPTKDHLHVSLPAGRAARISVHSLHGQVVYQSLQAAAKHRISTETWAPGVYLIQCSGVGFSSQKKVIKH